MVLLIVPVIPILPASCLFTCHDRKGIESESDFRDSFRDPVQTNEEQIGMGVGGLQHWPTPNTNTN